MNFYENIVEDIIKIRYFDKLQINTDSNELKQKAIEYIKENHYSLTDENVRFTMNKLKNQGISSDTIESERISLSELDNQKLIDVFNDEICKCVGEMNKGVSPIQLLEPEEKITFSTYTLLKLDPRLLEGLEYHKKSIVERGIIGILYVTENRIIMNCINSVLPIVTTTCYSLNEISSYSLTGIYSDELEIVLKSGQRICVGLFPGSNIEVYKKIVKCSMCK